MSNADIKEMLKDFYPFAKERMGFDRTPKFRFLTDPQNAADPLGKTAFYESDTDTVSVYTDNRHPKDILRSISHELVHHTQNCRGQLSDISSAGEQGYAQNDLHLREMERQAYEVGNMTFRDWEDGYKMSRENNLDEATIGTQNFDQLEQAGSQWKQSISTKQGVEEAEEAFVDMADKFLVPEMEALGFQSEAAYSIRSKRTLEFATGGERDIEAEIAPTSEGWYVQVYSFQSEEEFDEQQKVPDLRTAVEFIRKVVNPESAGGPRAGEDPSQMELPLGEGFTYRGVGGTSRDSADPFPVGSRVTHRAKTSLGVGTVKDIPNVEERRIEWGESFRKTQTTTEKVRMLVDASVKESDVVAAMARDVLNNLKEQNIVALSDETATENKTLQESKMSNNNKTGFEQSLRNMVGEEIKTALQNALLSEEETEQEDDEVSIDIDVDVDDGQEEEMDEGFLSRAKARAAGVKGAAKGLAKGGIKGMKAGFAGGKAASSLGKTSKSLYSTMRSLKKDAVAMNIDELPQVADALSNLEKSVEALRSATEELGGESVKEGAGLKEQDDKAFLKAMKTIMDELMILEPETRIKNAETLIANLQTVVDQAGSDRASLEEKVKAAIRSALLEEDEDKDGDEPESTEKYDDDPALKGDQDELPDELQAAIIDKAEDEDKDEDDDDDDDDDDDEEKNESLHERIKKSILSALNESNNPGTAFAPNHYCIHHGGVQHEGKIVAAEAVSHNYNEELGRVTHYNMRLEDGTVLENIASEDIQVTSASLAEGHKHNMNRDKDEEEVEEGYKSYKKDEEEVEEGYKSYNRDSDDDVLANDEQGFVFKRSEPKKAKATKESLSRLAEAGNRELNIRHSKLFEKLTKKWTK